MIAFHSAIPSISYYTLLYHSIPFTYHTLPYQLPYTIPYSTILYITILYHTLPYHLPYSSYHTLSYSTIPYTMLYQYYHTQQYHTIPYPTISYHTMVYTIPHQSVFTLSNSSIQTTPRSARTIAPASNLLSPAKMNLPIILLIKIFNLSFRKSCKINAHCLAVVSTNLSQGQW